MDFIALLWAFIFWGILLLLLWIMRLLCIAENDSILHTHYDMLCVKTILYSIRSIKVFHKVYDDTLLDSLLPFYILQ